MEPLNFGLLKEWLEEKKFFLVKDALAKRNEVDIAEFLEELPRREWQSCSVCCLRRMAADVFARSCRWRRSRRSLSR